MNLTEALFLGHLPLPITMSLYMSRTQFPLSDRSLGSMFSPHLKLKRRQHRQQHFMDVAGKTV